MGLTLDNRADRKIRVIVAKPGLDGHDRGVKVVASTLRDAGMEVIYLGLRQTPRGIVQAAIQEDADVIGLSVLSGAHMVIFREILQLMRSSGMEQVILFGGGIIPKEDVEALLKEGVDALYTPGTSSDDYIQFLRQEVPRRRALRGD